VSGSNGVSNGLVPMLRVFNGNRWNPNDSADPSPTHIYLPSHTGSPTRSHTQTRHAT
jgi:hypothetical protein